MKLEGAGIVILIGPGAYRWRNGSSWAVRWRVGRRGPPTTRPVESSGPPPGPRQCSVTRSSTKPSTASARAESQEHRRRSPSVKPSRPTSRCIASPPGTARPSAPRGSSRPTRPGAGAARAARPSAERGRLPTWSARPTRFLIDPLPASRSSPGPRHPRRGRSILYQEARARVDPDQSLQRESLADRQRGAVVQPVGIEAGGATEVQRGLLELLPADEVV